jgi:hypothetical protein
MKPRVVLALVWLALLHPVCPAQDATAPAPTQDIQKRAEALLDKARQLSDIRSPNAPAFRLKATFSFRGDDLETVQGTYAEVWASSSQWRRETIIGDLRYIEAGNFDKQWFLEPDSFPAKANRLATMMAVLPSSPRGFEFASIAELDMRDVMAECATTKPLAATFPYVFCFEKKSGVLLEKVSPETRPLNLVRFSCAYGAFRKFGDYWFPRQVECSEDRHKIISADVVELSIENPTDPTLFDAPKGAIELGQCLGKTVFPVPPARPFTPPTLRLEYQLRIRLRMVVDTKGRPQYLKILPPARKDSNESVANWVRQWSFSPGTCDGKPIPMRMIMEVPAAAR